MKKVAFLVAVTILCMSCMISCSDKMLDDSTIVEMVRGDMFEIFNGTIVGITSKAEKLLKQTNGKMIIPDKIDGCKIVGIGEGAFSNCKKLKEIILPNSIRYIGFGAFSNCTSLKKISVPFVGQGQPQSEQMKAAVLSSVLSTNNCAFCAGAPVDSSSRMDEALHLIPLLKDTESEKSEKSEDVFEGNNGNHFGYIFGAKGYKDNKENVPDSLKNVTISGSQAIEEYAFYHCESIEIVDLNYAARIADNAFEGCNCVFAIKVPGLSEVVELNSVDNLPRLLRILADNLTYMGTDDFVQYRFENGCLINDHYKCWVNEKDYNVEKAVVWANSKSVIADDGSVERIVAEAFDGSLLKEITIPSGVKLETGAFRGCEYLESVVLPSDMTEIPEHFFKDVGSLKNVRIPQTITKIGAWAFSGCISLENIELPQGLTHIEDRAFSRCFSLTELVIPSSVTNIALGAFTGCTNLLKITVDDANTVYHSDGNCLIETATKSLIAGCKNSVIPADGSVTTISTNAFAECVGLTHITIPATITNICEDAFSECTHLAEVYDCSACRIQIEQTDDPYHVYSNGGIGKYLRNVYTPESGNSRVTVVNDFVFYRADDGIELIGYKGGDSVLTLPNIDSQYTIGDEAFYGISAITDVTIPEGVTSIGEGAFLECFSLQKLSIPNSVNYIGLNAFLTTDRLGNSRELTCNAYDNALYFGNSTNPYLVLVKAKSKLISSCEIPAQTRFIYENAFGSCNNLESIVIPDGVTSIRGAFADCTELTSIAIPNSVTNIDYAFENCTSLTSITIPDGVTSIGDFTFSYCTGLTGITIPDGVTSIGDVAFSGCTGLTSITIPDGVTSIGDLAFSGCTGLTSIVIPEGVTSIGYWAFSGCTGLTSITIPDSVTSIDDWVLDGCTELTNITFQGTCAQWRAFGVALGHTGSSFVHCTDGNEIY